jgi:septal ring factor EnvC (AmiA/AmiB activator)
MAITQLIAKADEQIGQLDPDNKDDNKKIKAVEKDKKSLHEQVEQIDDLMEAIGSSLIFAVNSLRS